MMDLHGRMRDIQRRVLALKGVRPVTISQLDILNQQWSFALTLQALGDPADEAIYRATIICAGDPICDVAVDGFPVSTIAIVPAGIEWSISGNTATADIRLLNTIFSVSSMTVTIRAFALNGLSATCERIS